VNMNEMNNNPVNSIFQVPRSSSDHGPSTSPDPIVNIVHAAIPNVQNNGITPNFYQQNDSQRVESISSVAWGVGDLFSRISTLIQNLSTQGDDDDAFLVSPQVTIDPRQLTSWHMVENLEKETLICNKSKDSKPIDEIKKKFSLIYQSLERRECSKLFRACASKLNFLPLLKALYNDRDALKLNLQEWSPELGNAMDLAIECRNQEAQEFLKEIGIFATSKSNIEELVLEILKGCQSCTANNGAQNSESAKKFFLSSLEEAIKKAKPIVSASGWWEIEKENFEKNFVMLS